MSYVIINDTHLGLKRKTGVTKASLEAFQNRQVGLLALILEKHHDDTVIILGDLFDGGQVSYMALAMVHQELSMHKGKLILVAGNHDLDKNTEALSAFDFLLTVMPDAVCVKGSYNLEAGCTILSHLPNQTMFDQEIAGLVKEGVTTLLCHCNYDNGFAVDSDHSLNLSAEQAKLFSHVIMGHEHVKRDLPGVDILGSLLPCNIGECGVPHGYHTWAGPGHDVEFVEVWNPEAAISIDWKDLDSTPPDIDFIRVTGEATAEQAAMVIDVVAKFREAAPDAFLVTNSVKVGEVDLGALEEASETDLETFDPMALMKSLLSPEHKTKVEAFQVCR